METVKVKYTGKFPYQFRGNEYKENDVIEMSLDEFKQISKLIPVELVKEENAK